MKSCWLENYVNPMDLINFKKNNTYLPGSCTNASKYIPKIFDVSFHSSQEIVN